MKKVKYLLIAVLLMTLGFINRVSAATYARIFDLEEIVTWGSDGNQTSTGDTIIIVSGDNVLTVDGESRHKDDKITNPDGTTTGSGNYGYYASNTKATPSLGNIELDSEPSILLAQRGVYTDNNTTLTINLYNTKYDTSLYPSTTIMFNDVSGINDDGTNKAKNVKIKSNKDGTFSIRFNDANGYLTYDNGWKVTGSVDVKASVEIYKLVNEETGRNKVNIYNEKDEIVSIHNVTVGAKFKFPNYLLLTDVPKGYYFKGYTTTKGSDKVEYYPTDEIDLSGDLNVYPVLHKLTERYVYDDNVIVGEYGDDAVDEIYNGTIDVYFWYGFSKTPVKNTIYYKYRDYDSVDIVIKFLDGYDESKYSDLKEYLDDINTYPTSSKYVITQVLASQMTVYTQIKDFNEIHITGGMLDNVLGNSTVHIFLSPIFSTEYYVNNVIQPKYGVKNKYIINPADLDDLNDYANAVSTSIKFDKNSAVDGSTVFDYEIGETRFDVRYLPDLKPYEFNFDLPVYQKDLKWTFQNREVEGNLKASDLYKEIDSLVFKFYIVTPPNTLDNIVLYGGILLISIGGIILIVRQYKKKNNN